MTYQYQLTSIPLVESGVVGELYRGSMPWGLHLAEAKLAYEKLLSLHKIQKVVVLTSMAEIEFASEDMSPNVLDFYKSRQILPIHFPIDDGGTPREPEKFRELVLSIASDLRAGVHILVHCMGGYGRTGLVLACVVKVLSPSFQKEQATAYVRQYVKGAIETQEQERFIANF